MEKYDAFNFSKAVDQMEDFGWCPLCNNPAEIDHDKS